MASSWNAKWLAAVVLVWVPLRAAQAQALTVLVYDYAGLPDAAMHELRKVAGSLMLRVGIRGEFVECAGAHTDVPGLCKGDLTAGRVLFRILPHRPDDDKKLGRALAFSLVPGAYGSLYAAEIRKFAEDHRLRPGTVMAYALVHEIGHLLLGPAHSALGVMRNPWGEAEIRAMDKRSLGFTAAEAAGMRAAVSPE